MTRHQRNSKARPARLNASTLFIVAGIVSLILLSAWYVSSQEEPPSYNSLAQVSDSDTTNASTISQSVSLAYDPSDGSLLQADQTGLSRWNTENGWQTVDTAEALALSGVVINPDQPTTLYISGRGLGVVRSDDGGNNWQAVNVGLPNQDVTALALHSFRRETLYAWIYNDGVYRTENGGASWERSPDQGPPDKDVRGLIHSTLPGSMNTGWLYAAAPTGAYLSMDCF